MSRRSTAGGVALMIAAIAGFTWSLVKYPIPTLIGVNVLTLIFFPDYLGAVFVLSVLVGVLYYAAKKSNLGLRLREDAHPQGEKRNRQQIIGDYLAKLRRDSFRHYAENQTRDCIREIMVCEGAQAKAPRPGEYLSSWQARPDVPQNYKDLARTIGSSVKTRLDALRAEEEKTKREAADRRAEELWGNHKELIERFFEVAERKVSVLDDYGDEHMDALPIEINGVLKKIAQKEGVSEPTVQEFLKNGYGWSIGEEYSILRKKLDEEFRLRHASERPPQEYNSLSGVEFETQTAHMLRQRGYTVSGTPATGDQGADLIAKKDGRTIVIQAKRYKGSVGNKAVQEVIGAVQFYAGTEGWVVTNSAFTPSAKALAQKTGIRLIDGRDLDRIE